MADIGARALGLAGFDLYQSQIFRWLGWRKNLCNHELQYSSKVKNVISMISARMLLSVSS